MASTSPGRIQAPVPGSPKLGTWGGSWSFRPIPCPTNSRTTENPRASALRCTAAPMSPTRPARQRGRDPGGQRLPGGRHQPHGLGAPLPHQDGLGGVPVESTQDGPEVEPHQVPVPQDAALGGIPWTTSSFTEMQTLAG